MRVIGRSCCSGWLFCFLTLVRYFLLIRDGAFIAAGCVETADRVLG